MTRQYAAAAPAVDAPIGPLATASYASGSFGTGVFSTVPTVLLLYYCTETLGLAPGLAAALVFAPKALAIVWDPFVGRWSDHSYGRFGRRRPFIALGTLGVVAAFIALFSTPDLAPATKAWWVGVSYTLLAMAYSLFAVPYIAVPAEVAGGPLGRSRLVGWRMACAMLGVLAGAGAAPLIVAAAGGGRSGYAAMGVVLGAACGLAMLAPLHMLGSVDGARARPPGGAKAPLLASIALVLADRRFRGLTTSYLLLVAAAGALSSATPYLVTRALGQDDAATGTALTVLLVLTTLSVPPCARWGRRFGERKGIVYAAAGYGLATILLGIAVLAGASWGVCLVIFGLIGIPFAALQTLPFVLLAETVHASRSGDLGSEGTYSGVWAAAEKLGLAGGPALTGVALWLGGSAIGHTVALFVLVVPAALVLAGLALLPRFRREQG